MRKGFSATAAVVLVALTASPPAQAASTPRSKISETKIGSVCFPGNQCVKTESVHGNRYEGYNEYDLPSSSEWVTGVYNAQGKVAGHVRTGGDVVVISPEAYARRDAGEKTYSIARIDGAGRSVKTPYTIVVPNTRRIGFDNRAGDGMSAVGMTQRSGRPEYLEDMVMVGGAMGGIARDGTLTSTFTDVVAVHIYGDYRILAHAGGKSFTIADGDFHTLSPKLDNLSSFVTAYREDMTDSARRLGAASRRIVFAVPITGNTGGRKLYRVLPRQIGEAPPEGVIGFAPILDYGTGFPCGPDFGETCRNLLYGWVGIWASEGAPLVSLFDPLGRPVEAEKFKALAWEIAPQFKAAVAQTLTGDWQVKPFQVAPNGAVSFGLLPDRYASEALAKSAVQGIGADRYRQLLARMEADKALERQRYEAWQRQQAEQERQRQERAAVERQENARADALIASGNADQVCATAWQVKSFYARTNLFDACARLRPAQQAQSRGFWGDLNAGLAAYNRALQSGGGAPVQGAAPSASYNDGSFERSMRSIDNTLRQVSDPNWNGAAAAAFR